MMRMLVDQEGQTTLMVTHDPVAAAHADVVVFLKDGRIADRVPLDRRAGVDNAASIATRMARLEARPAC